MKWPLHPIPPSTEVLVNPLAAPVNPYLPADYATRLKASTSLSGHAAGVPALQPMRSLDAGYDVACTGASGHVMQPR